MFYKLTHAFKAKYCINFQKNVFTATVKIPFPFCHRTDTKIQMQGLLVLSTPELKFFIKLNGVFQKLNIQSF